MSAPRPPRAPERDIGWAVPRASALLRAGSPAQRVRAEVFSAAGDGPEWRVLEAVWSLAEQSGAPLVPVLERFGAAMRDLERVGERRAVLLAGPRSTIRLVAMLPPAALLIGGLLGFDPFRAFSSFFGIAAMLAGTVLLLIGVRWANALTARVAAADWVAGWECELLAVGLGGGSPPSRALRGAVDCADRARAEWVALEEYAHEGAVARLVAESVRLGTPLGPVLLREAEAARRRAQTELERAAERLGIRVLIPLGVCVLPAFVLLGVVPVLLAVVSGAML